jgi:hypothetical protein
MWELVMLQPPPFDIVRCSWPRAVTHADGMWTSEPEWSAVEMPFRPQPAWRRVGRSICWMIDWREMFRAAHPGDRSLGGEMSGFHVVFRVRVTRSGVLTIWDDDGCVVRRDGRIVHDDRSAHVLRPFNLDVARGDELDVAHWQRTGDWLWGAAFEERAQDLVTPEDLLRPLVSVVHDRVRDPNGPPLKLYTSGRCPMRAIAAAYTLILRGYSPSEVWLFGEHQWSPEARRLFATAFPFARVVDTDTLLRTASTLGGPRLVEMARRYWFVMKALVSLLAPPAEFCLIDDDVFVLDKLDDALEDFRRCDLVYIPDMDHGPSYASRWGWIHGQRTITTGRFNAGLFWMRQFENPRRVAEYMLRVRAVTTLPWDWEQGLIANLYAQQRTRELPSARYFYPLFDGLPGGIIGYDYERNPCGFASVHFGGIPDKPDDETTLMLLPQLLGASTHAAHARPLVVVR